MKTGVVALMAIVTWVAASLVDFCIPALTNGDVRGDLKWSLTMSGLVLVSVIFGVWVLQDCSWRHIGWACAIPLATVLLFIAVVRWPEVILPTDTRRVDVAITMPSMVVDIPMTTTPSMTARYTISDPARIARLVSRINSDPDNTKYAMSCSLVDPPITANAVFTLRDGSRRSVFFGGCGPGPAAVALLGSMAPPAVQRQLGGV